MIRRMVWSVFALFPTLAFAQVTPQGSSGATPVVTSPLQGMQAVYHPVTGVPYAYILSSTVWPSPNIPVCWENPSAGFATEMGWVQDAISKSWERHSKLRFGGWLKCDPGNKGIRIVIADSGPHVLDLGTRINGKRNGMLLNFTFDSWSPVCKSSPSQREACIRSIAVHEFGHALGFAHEHNRPDTPGECTQAPQGTSGDNMLTKYDPKSVMNYCNPIYNNDGNLSELDINAIHKIYGAP